jgi:hypothetical protein
MGPPPSPPWGGGGGGGGYLLRRYPLGYHVFHALVKTIFKKDFQKKR